MSPQEACVILAQLRALETAAIQGAEPPPVTDMFPEAGSDDFLSKSVEDLSISLTDKELMEHKLVGALETNAFLAALQKASEAQTRSRIRNWADVYSQKSRISSGRGALIEQLRGVGAKVDDEWLTHILKVAEPILADETGGFENVV